MQKSTELFTFSEDGSRMLHTVQGLSLPIRISEYLGAHLSLSVTLIKRIKYGGVFLNGENVHMRAEVKNGDEIEILFPEEKSEGIPPIDLPLAVLYEDAHLLAVCKPKNMPTHPSKGNSLPTLANAVMHYYGKNFVFRAVTRLDRDTSGIVLIAKTQYAAAKLSEDMKAGRFGKIYTAVVKGAPDPKGGHIDAPIRREAEGSMKRIVAPDGKSALTEYRTLCVREDGNAVLSVRLYTGRTHQIRVHLSYIGHPLLGDFLYGEKNEEGYLLHCTKMELPHPITGEMLIIVSDPPF
ncbi:MAG: RluA family pseudouridine synthase [Clostridia bacterium]|nr:RluA family pseudouridine synthase [Clostridia bacterium]